MKKIMLILFSKIRTGLNLLLNDPYELLKHLRIELKKVIVNIIFKKEKNIINNGERYDPLLTTGYIDKSHIPRYEFALKYVSQNDIVLDIASGTGYGTEMLAKVSKQAYGVDISRDAINYAKEKRKGNNLSFIENDLYNNSIIADIVVSFETIEHIPNKKIEETIEKLSEYGEKIIIGSYPYKEKVGNNYHHYHFSLDEKNLEKIKNSLKVDIFYQYKNGIISDIKENEGDIQNLIFIIYK